MAPLIFNAVRQQMFQRVAAVSPLGRNRSAEDVAHCAFSVFFSKLSSTLDCFCLRDCPTPPRWFPRCLSLKPDVTVLRGMRKEGIDKGTAKHNGKWLMDVWVDGGRVIQPTNITSVYHWSLLCSTTMAMMLFRLNIWVFICWQYALLP